MEHTSGDIQLIFYKHDTIHQTHDTRKPLLKEVVKQSIIHQDWLDLARLRADNPLNIYLHTIRIDFFDTLELFYLFGYLKDYATSDFY